MFTFLKNSKGFQSEESINLKDLHLQFRCLGQFTSKLSEYSCLERLFDFLILFSEKRKKSDSTMTVVALRINFPVLIFCAQKESSFLA